MAERHDLAARWNLQRFGELVEQLPVEVERRHVENRLLAPVGINNLVPDVLAAKCMCGDRPYNVIGSGTGVIPVISQLSAYGGMFGILRRIRVVPSSLVTASSGGSTPPWQQSHAARSPPTISVTTSCVTGTLLNHKPIRDRSVSGFPLG